MTKPRVLDAVPLGRLAHPASNPEIVNWLQQQVDSGIPVIIPEIADYELRRSLVLEGLTRSITRLDKLESVLIYLPLTTAAMRQAAELWAEARRCWRPTADARALDGDVILAAQALAVGGCVATENVGHLSLFVEARDWRSTDKPA